ncbi:hypothetical protein ACE1SV_27320 [Streptomyces sp. E-15]
MPSSPTPSHSHSHSPSPSRNFSSASPRSPFQPPFRLPRPLGTDAPATCEVPPFTPVRVRGSRYRAPRRRGRAVTAGLAVTAAALVAAGPGTEVRPHDAGRSPGHRVADPVRRHAPAEPVSAPVSAPVRIADAATVRLLRPGDRVDVVAAPDPSAGSGARVLVRGARVTAVPEPPDGTAENGALVVLSVSRATAARLVGASTTTRLAVTLC